MSQSNMDAEKLLQLMEKDLVRAMTSKTELFCRDDLNSGLTVDDLMKSSYQEWLSRTRFSHLLVINLVDMLENKSPDDFVKFSDYYFSHDICVCLYKASKIGPKRFYGDFVRWMACDWAQVRIDSREFDGYKTQTDPPSVQAKIADISRKLLDGDDDLLTEEELAFLVHAFSDMWCRPLEGEAMWKSTCACPYDPANVSPHFHFCSGCGRKETNAGDLKTCGRCNKCDYGKYFKRYYCGIACQKNHWSEAHKAYHQNMENLLKDQ